MSENSHEGELKALSAVISALKPFGSDTQKKIIETVLTFFDLSLRANPENPIPARLSPFSVVASSRPENRIQKTGAASFSEDFVLSPKEFMKEKQPRTDVERVACLAYYLTHYRETPHFKTLDLSKLNTEAAQPKFANAAKATGNAVQYGYLVPANKGLRQISAAGEEFVRALPDRDAAKEALIGGRPRWRNKKKINGKNKQ